MDPKNWLLDKRVIRRNLKSGALDIKAHDKELKVLPDLQEASELLVFEGEEEAEEEAEEEGASSSEEQVDAVELPEA